MIWPTPSAPGTKRGMPCSSWGPWGPLTGLYGVSADLLGLPDAEYFIGWDLAPTPPASGTQKCRQFASWTRPLAINYIQGNIKGISKFPGDSQMENFLLVGTWHPHPQRPKVRAMYLMGAFGTTCRVIWGICGIIGRAKYNSGSFDPGV